MLKEKANIHIYKDKLRILITGSFIGLSIIILASVFMIIDKVGKPLLVEENTHLLEQYGNKIVAQLGQKILMSESLASTLANLTEELEYDSAIYMKTIPHLMNIENGGDLIIGGGLWPEPYSFDLKKERNSFFWGKDSNHLFVYFDEYNLTNGKGYHNEEWYVPAKYMVGSEFLPQQHAAQTRVFHILAVLWLVSGDWDWEERLAVEDGLLQAEEAAVGDEHLHVVVTCGTEAS